MALTKTTPIALDAATLTALETITADTEMPAARLAADNLALPTAPDVLATLLVYDGATLDLARGTAADGLQVNTELAAARLAADNLALPTAPDVLATLMAHDGTNLDLVRTALGTSGSLGASGVLAAAMVTQDGTNLRTVPSVSSIGDGNGATAAPVVGGYIFNGTNWDRPRNNVEGTALASQARTATNNSGDLINYNGSVVHVQINVTVWTADNLTPTIQGKDELSDTYYTILTGAAITGTGFTCLKIGPGITAAANVSAADMLPRTWRFLMTHAGATTTTYSVGYSLNV